MAACTAPRIFSKEESFNVVIRVNVPKLTSQHRSRVITFLVEKLVSSLAGTHMSWKFSCAPDLKDLC